jgi:magnesium chelatase family protein
VLQALREPLEDGVITISRAEGSVRFPAEFQLLLAANSCPCGRLGIRENSAGTPGAAISCFCSPEEVNRYWRRFGSALLDRIELRVPVVPPSAGEMGSGGGDTSAMIARRVTLAAELQRERMGSLRFRRNARIPAGLVERCCPLTGRGDQALHRAAARLSFSGRAYHGVLRVGRTIADLEGRDSIDAEHIFEAVDYRRSGDDPYDVLGIEG